MNMRMRIRFDRRLLAGVFAALAAGVFLAQAAFAGPPAPIVPDNGLQPQDGSKPFLVGHGVGVQIYSCSNGAWSFVAPRADLFGNSGQLIIHHFGGPSWQARDGSTVVGTVVDKLTVDQTAVPWLLLSASPAPGSKPGRLDQTTFIQRVNTVGGNAPPASECTPALAGTQVEVPYTADYYFWK
jgi:FtsP/CotA-like multicopper oxidase with cupredoxin domain